LKDFFFYVKRAGADGLPIVALLSFLLGLIIAFMSSLQLKQFGANVYVASLVGFGMVRELGPILTAIIIAGRSGSAFAAEIGTMKVNEEVDALVTMGFDPTRFLALPKVLAAMLVVPLLTIYADVFGIMGGMLVGVMGFDLYGLFIPSADGQEHQHFRCGFQSGQISGFCRPDRGHRLSTWFLCQRRRGISGFVYHVSCGLRSISDHCCRLFVRNCFLLFAVREFDVGSAGKI